MKDFKIIGLDFDQIAELRCFWLQHHEHLPMKASKEIEELGNRLKTAMECIGFYADEINWKSAGNNQAKTLIINDREDSYPAVNKCAGRHQDNAS